MSYRPLIILTLVGLFFAAPAYAYLDPGSGSIILQGILAAIAGVLATIKLYWRKLKSLFSRKKTHSEEEKKEQEKHDKE